MPKASGSDSRQAQRHNPLSEEYAPTAPLRQKAPKRRKSAKGEGEEENYVDTKASRRILQIGQELVDEDTSEQQRAQPNPAFDFASRFGADDDSDDDEGKAALDEDDEAWGDEGEEEIGGEELVSALHDQCTRPLLTVSQDVDPHDQDIFNKFHPSNITLPSFDQQEAEEPAESTNLADLILEKIAAHEAQIASGQPAARAERGASPTEEESLPDKVIEVYTKVGELLSRHRSGPLPKPFKIIPSLPPSQQPAIILITRPDDWTPHVHFLATRLFISASPAIAQPFLTNVLLPRVRDDIRETKKLHVHLYNAIKKSLYKPACFFKGFLFPLLEEQSCTLREAHIIGSVLSRVSIPVLHSAAALLRLCDIAAEQFSISKEDGGGGATNTFIRVLLEKKYALPYKVVDALVFHFLRFKALVTAGNGEEDVSMTGTAQKKESKLPVLWHQSLLAFSQRYRNDITEDQREALLDLVNLQGHKLIGPEVRRELLAGRGRGVPAPEDVVADGGDDTMMMG